MTGAQMRKLDALIAVQRHGAELKEYGGHTILFYNDDVVGIKEKEGWLPPKEWEKADDWYYNEKLPQFYISEGYEKS